LEVNSLVPATVDAMRVRELIDILRDQPPEAEVELAVVAPVEDDNEDITVDRYSVEGVLPWEDEGDEGVVIWLVGGEDDDVDSFLDAIEEQEA
jgi:hypothetical protein